MDRRTALKTLGLTALSAATPVLAALAPSAATPLFGWKNDQVSLNRWISDNAHPFFTQLNKLIKGDGEGQIALPFKFLERVQGHALIPHKQGIGDCVSHGFATSVDVLTSTQILQHHKPERWVGEAATEPIYGGSRQEIGNYNSWGDGSTGHWAADWLLQYGVLLRKPYLKWDFSKYSAKLAKEFGSKGVPDPLEPLAKLHPVKTATIITTYEDACDALYNGYPIAVCSNVGFGDSTNAWVRDSEGFLRRRRAPWYHCMAFIGMDDKHSRPGLLCQNSWGDFCSGPKRHEQPDGSFWIDADTVNVMLRGGDSFALSSYVGYPKASPYIFWGAR